MASSNRRLVHFSMRTLLVFVTLSCMAMGVWSIWVQPYRDQAVAFDKILSLGGQWSLTPAKGSSWQRWLVNRMVGDDRFVEITHVDLSDYRIDASDVEALAGFNWVRSLHLDRAEVTDENLPVIASLSRLEILSLSYTQVTDRGIASLQRLANLKTLYLTGAPISDESTTVFASMLSLQKLFIRWTGVSNNAASRLELALPDCEVYHHDIRIDQNPAAQQ